MNVLDLAKKLINRSDESTSKLSKAYLEIYRETGTKKVSCLVNPSTYSIQKSVEYRQIRALGSDAELKQFARCNASVLSVTLFFDSLMAAEGDDGTSGEGKAVPVTDYTKEIMALTRIDGKLHRPARVGFVWGKLNFVGVVISAEESFLMFDKTGKPLRERLTLQIESVKVGTQSGRQSPFESPDRTKYVRFSDGMSLWALAAQEYGDCEQWKRLADANGIENPLQIEPGTLLQIPALTEE